MFYSFKGVRPVVHKSSYVHPQAVVIGHVLIEEGVYIGPSAVIRGDWGKIHIKQGCNIQENCTIHMFPGVEVILEMGAHIGHGAVIHGAQIGKNALIGMNAVVMDEVVVGANCIVGALSFVKAGSVLPENSLVVGNPAKVVKSLPSKMIEWKREGTALYETLARGGNEWLKPCDPLTEYEKVEIDVPKYLTWKEYNDMQP